MELERLDPKFEKRSVDVIALISDDKEHARAMAGKNSASHLRISYGISLWVPREWGLYLSVSRGKTSFTIEGPAGSVCRAGAVPYAANVSAMPPAPACL